MLVLLGQTDLIGYLFFFSTPWEACLNKKSPSQPIEALEQEIARNKPESQI